MIIGIDGNEANVEKQVGVSVYTLNLLDYFQKKADENTRFRIFLREKPKDFLPKENKLYKYCAVRGKFFWSQLFLPLNLYLPKNRVQVFFSPAHYAPRFCPAPFVVTIHDLSYFYYPKEFLKKDLYQLKNWTKYSVEKSAKVIAVSKTTKKDLMKWYQIPDEKIEVIYNGFKKTSGNCLPHEALAKWGKLKIKNYLLYVGTIQPRKNLNALIEAFNLFQKNHPDFKLVIAGKKGWLYEEIFNLVEKLGLKEKVIFTGYVPDDELAALYKNAFCLIMPSLYEGFGLPILEAMAYSCPVISSFNSSLPEVGGEAALYFDPKNPQDLLDKINELFDNKKIKEELIEKGKNRVKSFSWEKCAQETLEVIKSVNGNNL